MGRGGSAVESSAEMGRFVRDNDTWTKYAVASVEGIKEGRKEGRKEFRRDRFQMDFLFFFFFFFLFIETKRRWWIILYKGINKDVCSKILLCLRNYILLIF